MSNSTRRPSRRSSRISPEDYAEFIRQIELTGIWLDYATIDNEAGPQPADQVEFEIESKARYETVEEGFLARHSYEVSVRSRDGYFADLEVRFAVRFSSHQEMTDQIFELFQDVNLPVNTWPYLREFVSSMLGRMGWQPITLPALKRGTEPAGGSPKSTPKPARPGRRSTKKAD